MENSQQPEDRDVAIATFNVSLANLAANLVILTHIEEQIALHKQEMADNAKFHRELLQMLERIIKNQ